MAALTGSRWGTMFPKPFEGSRDVNQLFDALLSSVSNSPAAERTWFATAALWEEGDCFHVEADMPGVQREDIDVTLEKNVLRVGAERKAPQGERTYWHNERGYGRVERSITLPETVDPESIEAQLKDGVLYLSIRKRPETLPKKIDIK